MTIKHDFYQYQISHGSEGTSISSYNHTELVQGSHLSP